MDKLYGTRDRIFAKTKEVAKKAKHSAKNMHEKIETLRVSDEKTQEFREISRQSQILVETTTPNVNGTLEDIYRANDEVPMLGTQVTLKEYRALLQKVKDNAQQADNKAENWFTFTNSDKMITQFQADIRKLLDWYGQLGKSLDNKDLVATIKATLESKGVTRQDGSVTIDLAKFDPHTVDLSKLDLSNGLEHFNYNTLNIDKTKFNQNLSENEIIDIDGRLNFVNNCLKSGYRLKTYEGHPELYRKVLEYYMYLKSIQKIEKANSNRGLESGSASTSKLVEENRMKRLLMPPEKPEQNKSSQSDQKKTNPERPRDIPKPNLLFSNNQAERDFAIEKVLTDAYMLHKKEEQERCRFNAKVQELLPENMTAEDRLQRIRMINEKFKQAAKDNPEPYWPDLEYAIKRTRTLYQWATKFQDQFNLDEDWVRTGMKRLGITKDNFTASLDKLLHNELVNDEITGNSLSVDAIVNGDTDTGRLAYDKTKIVEHFEEFTRANAMLNSIHGLLKEGIPATEIPRQIKGLERVSTSGNKNNCLIYALMKVHKPNFDEKDKGNQNCVLDIRNTLKEKMGKRVQLERGKGKLENPELEALRDRYEAVKNNKMLDLGSYDGQELIDYLRESKLMEHNRGVLVYQFKEGKILCDDHPFPSSQDTSSQEKPYTLFLYQDFHFEAMIEPQK